MRLQRISFNHSDIPPSWCAPHVITRLESHAREQRLPTRDLELSVFAATEQHGIGATELVSRQKPAPAIPHVDEDVFAEPRVEVLDDSVPAPVAALRAQRHHPAALSPLASRS